MYPRLGQFRRLFTINVHDHLGASKGASFMMLTGLVDLPNSNAQPLATSVVYVLNTTTGNYACYAIPVQPNLHELQPTATRPDDACGDRIGRPGDRPRQPALAVTLTEIKPYFNHAGPSPPHHAMGRILFTHPPTHKESPWHPD